MKYQLWTVTELLFMEKVFQVSLSSFKPNNVFNSYKPSQLKVSKETHTSEWNRLEKYKPSTFHVQCADVWQVVLQRAECFNIVSL